MSNPPPSLTARPVYQQNFDVDEDGWITAHGSVYAPEPLEENPGLGSVVSEGPWWVDPNHIAPGAGYLNLLAIKHSEPAGVQDFTDLVLSFDLSTDNLHLPTGAHLYVFFQAIDQTIAWGNGDRVNYVNVANPISFDANGDAHVEVHFRPGVDSDWLALGSSFARDDAYSVSTDIAHAMAALPVDFGLVVLLGNQLNPSDPATGSLIVDQVTITQENGIRAAVTATPAIAQLLGLDVDLEGGANNVFDGGVIELSQANDGSTSSLSILADPSHGLTVDQGTIYLDQQPVAVIGAGSDAHHLIIEITASLADDQIETLISRLALAPGNLAAGAVAQLQLSFTDTADAETDLGIQVRVRAPFYEGEGNDDVVGTGADEALRGGAGSDVLHGLGGIDQLDGGPGADQLIGGLGDDLYFVDNAGDVVVENAGEGDLDRVFAAANYTLGAGASIEIVSTTYSDGIEPLCLTGNNLSQYVYGNAGANKLDGGGGGDVMIGFEGDDVFYVRNAADRVLESAGGGFDRVLAAASFTLEANSAVEMITTIDNLATTAINLTGNNLAQHLYGNAGANTLDGAGGGDVMIGFEGDDLFYVRTAADRVVESAGGGTDRVSAATSFTLEANCAVEIITTIDNLAANAINLTGNSLAQYIYGNAGANVLDGKGGGDVMVGLEGDDLFYVRSAADRVVEAAGGGTDRIFAATSFTLEANSAVEMITTIDNLATTAINLTGNNLAQYIYGNAGSNMLDGNGGGDVLVGFEGNDFYTIRNAADRVVEAAGGGSDRVLAAASFTLEAGSQVEMLTTIDNLATTAVNLAGNELGQYLFGNAGANSLDGKGGADVMTGFGGSDSFAFTSALNGGNIDRITDFASGTDKVALDDAVFTALAPGALNPNAFVIGTAAADADDRIVYNQTTGALLYDADGTGAGAAIQFATLDTHPIIAASDFSVI